MGSQLRFMITLAGGGTVREGQRPGRPGGGRAHRQFPLSRQLRRVWWRQGLRGRREHREAGLQGEPEFKVSLAPLDLATEVWSCQNVILANARRSYMLRWPAAGIEAVWPLTVLNTSLCRGTGMTGSYDGEAGSGGRFPHGIHAAGG